MPFSKHHLFNSDEVQFADRVTMVEWPVWFIPVAPENLPTILFSFSCSAPSTTIIWSTSDPLTFSITLSSIVFPPKSRSIFGNPILLDSPAARIMAQILLTISNNYWIKGNRLAASGNRFSLLTSFSLRSFSEGGRLFFTSISCAAILTAISIGVWLLIAMPIGEWIFSSRFRLIPSCFHSLKSSSIFVWLPRTPRYLKSLSITERNEMLSLLYPKVMIAT